MSISESCQEDIRLIERIKSGDNGVRSLLLERKMDLLDKASRRLWGKYHEMYRALHVDRQDIVQHIALGLLEEERFRSFDSGKITGRGVDGYLSLLFQTVATPKAFVESTRQRSGKPWIQVISFEYTMKHGDTKKQLIAILEDGQELPVEDYEREVKSYLLERIVAWWGNDDEDAIAVIRAVFTKATQTPQRCMGIRSIIRKGAHISRPSSESKKHMDMQVGAEWLYARKLLLSCYAKM